MENRTLEVYTFNLFDKNYPDTKIDFANAAGKDLFKLLKADAIQFFENIGPENLLKKTLKIDSENSLPTFKANSALRILTGKVKVGDDDGKVQDFIKGNKSKTLVYTKQKGIYAERPFYFMMVIPKNKKLGLLILEKEGTHTCKKVFEKALKKFVKTKMSGLMLGVESYIEDDIVKNYIANGEYNRISITRQNIPKDLSKLYLGSYEDGGEYELELVIKTKKGTDFNDATKKKVLKNMDNYDGFFTTNEFKKIGFDDTTNLKIVSTFEGTTKTIDLSDTMRMRPYYTISVKINSKGFSDFDSINNEAMTLLKSFNMGII